MFYEDSKTVRQDLNRFINDHFESGVCTESQWEEFVRTYESEYGYTPKLYGDDIKVISDTVSVDVMEFDNPSGYSATISVEKGQKAKFYMLTVREKDTHSIVLAKDYPTLRGCKIAMGRQFPGWVWPEAVA